MSGGILSPISNVRLKNRISNTKVRKNVGGLATCNCDFDVLIRGRSVLEASELIAVRHVVFKVSSPLYRACL